MCVHPSSIPIFPYLIAYQSRTYFAPFGICRYDLKQGTVPYVISFLSVLSKQFGFSRNFEESGVEGANRACEARGSATQGFTGDEAQARRGGPGLSVGLSVMRRICAVSEGRSSVKAIGSNVYMNERVVRDSSYRMRALRQPART